jgi:hypothetical protein
MPGEEGLEEGIVKLEDGSTMPLRAVTHRNVERFVGHWMRGVLGGEMVGEANVGVLIRRMSPKTAWWMMMAEDVC